MNTLVGTFEKSKNFGFVVPDNKKIPDIFISKSNWRKAKNNQRVLVEIIKKSEKGKSPEGKIIKILDNLTVGEIDMISLISEFNLPKDFSKKVKDEAKRIAKEEIILDGRVDLRKKQMFTIDGEDAKDLDDAVCVEKDSNNIYTLTVSIADVSHYVKDGSEIDKEAAKRGTSVYMLNNVIPMLPKELSNGICSLNQKEDRYAMSITMKINEKGEVIDSEIKKTIINVTRRMSYHEVYSIINRDNFEYDEKNKFKTKMYVSKILKECKKYFTHFDLMRELAEILKERRMKNGYLSLDIPESDITLDSAGIAIDIKPYETNFANEIIEQFMLTANEEVAEKFYYLEAPFIYRVHESPDEEKVSELSKYLWNFGYKIKGKKEDIKPKEFSKILDDIKGKDEEQIIANKILRTLKIARYEAENEGHFGIASKYYCHFTSPIRRYPDLFIHRVISSYLENDYIIDDELIKKYKIEAEKYSIISSEREQLATKAERESEKIKKAEYMEGKIGEEYEGVISSITSFGIFVALPNTIEGLVQYTKMYDDFYVYDETQKTAIGESTKKIYKIGDKVKIRILNASKALRFIDFEFIE